MTKRKKILTAFLGFTLLIGAGLIFLDLMIMNIANFAFRNLQDGFQIRVSRVDSEPFDLQIYLHLAVKDKSTGNTVIISDELSLDLNFEGLRPYLDIRMQDTKIDLTKDLISRLKNKNEENQTKIEDSTGLQALSYLGSIELRNMDISYSHGGRTLFTTLNSLGLNFPNGKGMFKGISAYLRKENLRLVEIQDINLEFDSQRILDAKSTKLGVEVNGARLTLAIKAVEVLKGLIRFPDEETEKEGGTPFNELSYIRLNDTTVIDKNRNLEVFAEIAAIDFEKASTILVGSRAKWTHTQRELFSLGKASGKFTPGALKEGIEPKFSFIITDLNLQIGRHTVFRRRRL